MAVTQGLKAVYHIVEGLCRPVQSLDPRLTTGSPQGFVAVGSAAGSKPAATQQKINKN
jgi:hypothetical protein